MKIFYDYQSIFRQQLGGVSKYHYELYKRIAQFPNVEVSCKVFGSPNIYFQDVLGYKAYEKYGYNWWFFDKANKISNLLEIQKKTYDVIHPTWYSPKAYNPNNRAKYVITIHDMIHEIYRGDLSDCIEEKRFWIYKADEIIAVSNNTKKDILRFYPDINPDKITVIPISTNKDVCPQKPLFELPKKYFLYVGGRSYDYKNFDMFVKVATKILKCDEEIHLLVVGGRKLEGQEMALFEGNRVEKRVHVVSASDNELAYIYRNAECFIHPSLYEGFGMTILEAFANKCPVVCSRASSFPEVAEGAAIYFDPMSEEDMFEKTMQVLTNDTLRNELRKKGVEQLKKFSWDVMAKKTMEVYKK